jgi:hypothetical protein
MGEGQELGDVETDRLPSPVAETDGRRAHFACVLRPDRMRTRR